MQGTHYKVFKLAITNMNVAKTATSFFIGIIPRVMAFFIIIITGDLKNVFSKALVIVLLLFLTIYGPSVICFSCDRTTT